MFSNNKRQKIGNALEGDVKKATSSYGVQKEEMELKFAVQMEEMKGLEVKGLRFRGRKCAMVRAKLMENNNTTRQQ